MTAKRPGTRRILALLLLLIALAAVGAVWLFGRAKVEDRYPVTKKDVVLPHATRTVKSPDMWSNQRAVEQVGKDGLAQDLTYFHERLVDGKLTVREQVATPKGKPSRVVVSEPTTEVVVVGTRKGASYAVNSSSPTPQQIGAIGLTGSMWVEASGTVLFAKGGGVAGVFGNRSYRYYWTPVRDDVAPGALLFRVSTGDWVELTALTNVGNAYLLEGRPGDKVFAIVNDAPRYFEDNQGSFTVMVWPDGVTPKE